MAEILQPRSELFGIDPLCVRDKVIEAEIQMMGMFNWNSLHPANSSRPFVIRKLEGLAEAGTLSSAADFDARLDDLGRNYYALLTSGKNNDAELLQAKMRAIQNVYESLRLFWEDVGPFDLGSVYTTQRLLNKPIWSDEWRFREQVKPPHQFSEEYGDLNETYQRLEIGSIVEISGRWAGVKQNPDEGKTGEVLGFTIGLQAQYNMDYLIVTFKDNHDWLHQSYLHTLDLVA